MSRKLFVGVLFFLSSVSFVLAGCSDARHNTGQQTPTPDPAVLAEFEPVETGYLSITSLELREAITLLASPELKGRRSGTSEGELSTSFIRSQLEGAFAGIPGTRTFFQSFFFWEVANNHYQMSPELVLQRLQGAGFEVEDHGRNVVGILEGDERPDEYVLIVAHVDHVGVQGGEIHPGADDNASGTAAVLEIAEAFGILAREGLRPARSIIFLLADAEEWGLWGSQYFVEHSPAPLESIVAVLNIDMVGRNDSREVHLIGSPDIDDIAEKNPDLYEATKRANKILRFKLVLPGEEGRREQIFYRSDHASFFLTSPATDRIPVLFYTSGLHDDYHKPTDTADKINFTKAQNIARLAFLVAWQIAEDPEVPDFVEK